LDVGCRPKEIGHLEMGLFENSYKMMSVVMSRDNITCMILESYGYEQY